MFIFADLDQARGFLCQSDAFTRRLGPFELQARMKSDRPVSEKEFLSFAAGCALAWDKHEQTGLESVIRNLEIRLQKYRSLFPAEILLIKTDGREESNCAYTRQNAVVLPPAKLAYSPERLERFLAHELFHILSRRQPGLRSELYNLLGFRLCNEIAWPENIRDLRITNPDSFLNDYYILLYHEKIERAFVPIFFSRSGKYDFREAAPHFSYLVSRFMAVRREEREWRPDLSGGRSLLADLSQVRGFQERIDRPAGRIEQPEELLAEDFVNFLWNEPSAAAPRVQKGMRMIFSSLNK